MTCWKKRSIALMVVTTFMLSFAAVPALAQEEGDPAMPLYIIGDLLIARPVGVVVTLTGLVLYGITFPATFPIKEHRKVWNALVVEPAEFTFIRPVGEF
jgi:hypothetical protein